MAAPAAGAARYVLAFDTANEVISIGLGALDPASRTIEPVATTEVRAHRASNTQLIPHIDELLAEHGIARVDIACVACGRGPGSFTGVRIAMATAKGVASALGVGLVGFSTLDAVAWNAWAAGVRGRLLVAADAMRKEVYPVRYALDDSGAHRLEADRVVKAADVVAEYLPDGASEDYATRRSAAQPSASCAALLQSDDGINSVQTVAPSSAAPVDGPDATVFDYVTGDALVKYEEVLTPLGAVLSRELWEPTGRGLLLAVQALWQTGEADPFDAVRHNPAFALPVYTRLSDAEENERIRLAKNDPKNLRTGVQDLAPRRDQRATMHDSAILNARPDAAGITYKPLDAAHAAEVAALEARIMGSDAWNEHLVADELPRTDRTWWAAYCVPSACRPTEPADAAETLADAMNETEGLSSPADPSADLQLIGYAGGWVVDGDVQILKVGVDPAWRRHGIARELLSRVASDARDLGARTCSLEVRAGNEGAQAFYRALDFESLGKRPRYYSDGEDALIMQGPLPLSHHDVAGMELQIDNALHSQEELRARAGLDGIAKDSATRRSVESSMSFVTSARVSPALEIVGMAEAKPTSVGEPLTSPRDWAPGEAAASSSSDGRQAGGTRYPLILAIESSCDETAAAIVDGEGNLVADVVASQIDFHSRFGGVVPEIASRKHIEAICGVCDECFEAAAKVLGVPQLTWHDLDAVGVTYAPGLLGALVVGVAFAKGAAWAADKPLIGVHHLEGHLYANRIGAPDLEPPMVASLVSGGNTLLVHVKDWGDYETLGATIDDAVGEAFDKVAKALGLGYPGGPVISRVAAQGDPDAIPFPRAMLHSGDLRFSLSGLKTAVVTYINNERAAGRELNIPDIAASFQQAVVDVQVAKAKKALQLTGARTFCLGGGVAANPVLRASYEQLCAKMRVRLIMPPLSACGDNAGMIALVALDRYRQGKFMPLDADAQAHADLDEPY